MRYNGRECSIDELYIVLSLVKSTSAYPVLALLRLKLLKELNNLPIYAVRHAKLVGHIIPSSASTCPSPRELCH
jgi:hypothetical protein